MMINHFIKSHAVPDDGINEMELVLFSCLLLELWFVIAIVLYYCRNFLQPVINQSILVETCMSYILFQ